MSDERDAGALGLRFLDVRRTTETLPAPCPSPEGVHYFRNVGVPEERMIWVCVRCGEKPPKVVPHV